MQPFTEPDSVVKKFQTQDIYALPPQIFPCNDFDLPDFRYLNSNFFPVKHPFKDNLTIESYNSIWLDNISIVSRSDLKQICGKEVVPARKPAKLLAVENTTALVPVVVLPDTIEEMDTYLHDNVGTNRCKVYCARHPHRNKAT